jgi:hypothetical protein
MRKPIRLREINRVARQIRSIREQLNNNNNSYQPTGASSSAALDPKTAKVKGLFEMFWLIPRV